MATESESKGISRRDVFGAIAGAAMTVAAVLPGAAQAAEKPFIPFNDISQCELSTPEICDLDVADTNARDYALENPGVGILVHVGYDFPNEHFQTPQQFGQAVVNAFAHHGVEAQYFLTQNDVENTVMAFYVAHLTYDADKHGGLKSINEAYQAIPEIAAVTKTINGVASAPPVLTPASDG